MNFFLPNAALMQAYLGEMLNSLKLLKRSPAGVLELFFKMGPQHSLYLNLGAKTWVLALQTYKM